jgi:hypothetical protein
MKDLIGQEVDIGDVVVFSKRNELYYGTVLRFTPKRVQVTNLKFRTCKYCVKGRPRKNCFRKGDIAMAKDVVKVDARYVTMKLLLE